MGRGVRQPSKDQPTATVRDINAPDVSDQARYCWQFAIVRPTNAKKVQIGDAVTGSIHGKLVMISTRGEALGFAPDDAGNAMVGAVRNTHSSLLGRVLSIGKDGFASTVELCLS